MYTLGGVGCGYGAGEGWLVRGTGSDYIYMI